MQRSPANLDRTVWSAQSNCPSQTPPAVQAPARIDSPVLDSARLLLVEDDFFILLELETMLIEAGARIVGCCRTVEAALILANQSDIDAALLDVRLGTGTIAPVARRLAEQERTPATFICADAQTHAFEPASFDLITSRFGVMFFTDPVQAFANLRKAAASDARLCCIAWRSAAENPYMTTAERAAAPFLPNLQARIANAPGQFGFADAQRVHAILEESGWTEIEIRPIDVLCTLPESELNGYATRFGPVGVALREADPRTRAQVIATVRAAFAPFVHADEVRFTGSCWMIGARR